jgi:LPXTG-site transpeptidase (sortase) family protein
VVVVGHTVRAGGGVFDHLAGLRPGDDVGLRTATGWVKYDVAESRTLTVEELARRAGALFTRTGPGRLVLVTCTDFDGEVYRGRTVVVAHPVSRAEGSPG